MLTFPQGKRVFVKDMAQYFMPDEGRPASIAPSLVTYRRGVGTSNGSVPNGVSSKPSTTTNGSKHGPPYPYNTEAEPGNPTVVPDALLRRFHFTFLIRHPRNSVPSYYRCTIPPLDDMTGFHYFDPREAGYLELRRMFDYLRGTQQCGPAMAGKDSPTYGMEGAVKTPEEVEICVIDADDLLDNPAGIMEAYCNSAGLEYTPDMLNWDNEKDQKHAKVTFEKWKGFHEDAIDSTELRPRAHVSGLSSSIPFEMHCFDTKAFGVLILDHIR